MAKTGHYFTGWNTAADGSGTDYEDGDEVSNLSSVNGATVTLYAQWSVAGFDLSIYSDEYGYGDPYALSADDGSYEIYADDGPTSVDYGSLLQLYYDMSVEGYHLVSWNVTSDATVTISDTGEFTMPAAEVIIQPTIEVDTYTVIFNANGGSGTKSSETFTYDDYSYQIPENTFFSRTGYKFIGWSDSQTGSVIYDDEDYIYADGNWEDGEEITLYAVWSAIDYILTVTANQNGSITSVTKGGTTNITSAATGSGATVNYNDSIAIVAAANTGYHFDGWTVTDGSVTLANSSAASTGFNMPDSDVSIEADFAPNSYTITFSRPDATTMGTGSISATFGQAMPAITPPARTGYTFNGYYTAATGGTKYYNADGTSAKSCDLTADTTLHAQWTINSNALTLTVEPASYGVAKATWTGQTTGVSSGTVNYGDTVDITATANTGYHFVKWFVTTENATLANAESAVTSFTMPDADVTVKAGFAVNTYTVRFNRNTGSGTQMGDQNFSYYTSQNLSANTYTKTGFEFLGWSKSSSATTATYEDGQSIGGTNALTDTHGDTVNLYAVWSEIDYKLTIDLDDGSEPASLFLNYNDVHNLTTPQRTGYTFSGWTVSTDTAATVQSSVDEYGTLTMGNGDTTVTAQWTPRTYSIYFNGNGSTSGTMTSMTNLNYGQEYQLSANGFTKTGYTFAGWNTAADGTGTHYNGGAAVNSLCTGEAGNTSITLYAEWTLNSNDLTITVEQSSYGSATAKWEGQSSGVTYGVVNYNTTVTITATPNTGYHFVNWTVIEGGASPVSLTSAVTTFAMPDADVTIRASFAVNSYTAAFNGNGATSGSMQSQQFSYFTAQNLLSNGFARTGYEFLGWALSGDATVASFEDGAQISADNALTGTHGITITLYAIWKQETYTLTIDPNNENEPTEKPLVYGATDTLPTVSKRGYTYQGWSVTAMAATATVNTTITGGSSLIMGDGDTTVTAQYSANSYTITFNANGGSGVMNDMNCYYDTAVYLTANTFAPSTGLSFVGWNTKTDGSGTSYQDQALVSNLCEGVTGDMSIVLYAQWSANAYLLTLTVESSAYGSATARWTGQSAGATTGSVVYNDTVFIKAVPSQGYHFVTWAIVSGTANITNPTLSETSFSMPSNNLTLKATFAINTYNVIYSANGGTGTAMENQLFTYNINQSLRTNTYTKAGNTFGGWALSPLGSAVYEDGETIGSANAVTEQNGVSVTLYAVWDKITYKLTIDPDNNTGTSQYNVDFGQNFNIPESMATPSKTGYTFSYWTVISDIGATIPATINYGTIITIGDSNATAKAIYTANAYTIVFNANGGTGSAMESIPMTYDIGTTLPSVSFTPPVGYVFKNWNTAANGSGTSYAANAQVLNLASADGATVTLYAQWMEASYTLTFDPVMGELQPGAPYKKTITYGSVFSSGPSISAVPTENYWPENPNLTLSYESGDASVSFEFLGWYNGTLDESGNVVYGIQVASSSTVSTPGDRTIYAKWSVTETEVEQFDTLISDVMEINLNHYETGALEALDSKLVDLFGEQGAIGTSKAAQYKTSISSAYENIEDYKLINDGAGPKINVFETKEKQLTELNSPSFGRYLDGNGNIFEEDLIEAAESMGDVSYVMPGKCHYTYHCYTNNEAPMILVNVSDVPGANGRVSYPTMAKVDTTGTNGYDQKLTRTGTVKSGWMQYTCDTEATNTDRTAGYEILDMSVNTAYSSKYSYAGSSYGEMNDFEYYEYSQYIVLKPTFDKVFKDSKQYAIYTITAYDDSYESLIASESSLAGAGQYGSFAEGASIETSSSTMITPNNTVTIYVEYKNVTGFDGTDCGGQIEGAGQPGGYLQCYTQYSAERVFKQVDYLYRNSAGATNDELLLKVPESELATKYVANDPLFGQTNLGNFFQMVPSDSAVVSKYFEVYDEAKSGGATEAQATKLAGRAATQVANAAIKSGLSNGTMTDATLKPVTIYQTPGEYYIWPQANSSFIQTYCPAPNRESTLVYVHLADRWGNEFTNVVRRDLLDRSTPSFSDPAIGSITVNEYGGSTLKEVKILSYTQEPVRKLVDVQPYSGSLVDYSWDVDTNSLTVSGLDPTLNSGKYVLYVEDWAGCNNKCYIQCTSNGMFTITICDESMPEGYRPVYPEGEQTGVELLDIPNETETAEAPASENEISIMTIDISDADEAGGSTLEPKSELTVVDKEPENEDKSGSYVDFNYSFVFNEVYTVNLFTKTNKDYNVTLKSTTGGSIRTFVNNEYKAPKNGLLMIPGGSDVQVKIITYSGYELTSITMTDSSGVITALDGSYTTEIHDDVTITAYFAETSSFNTVTVFNGTIDGKETVKVNPYTQVMAIANKAPEGKVFAYWASGGADGSIVSYDEAYIFFVTGDTVLTAVYADSAVTAQPSVVMDAASSSHITVVNGKYSLAYSGKLTIPEGYTLVEFGLVLSNQPAEYYTSENFVIGGAVNGVNTAKIRGESLTEQGQFKINVNNVASGATRAGRLYMVYKDAAGNEVLIYSSTWSVLTTP